MRAIFILDLQHFLHPKNIYIVKNEVSGLERNDSFIEYKFFVLILGIL